MTSLISSVKEQLVISWLGGFSVVSDFLMSSFHEMAVDRHLKTKGNDRKEDACSAKTAFRAQQCRSSLLPHGISLIHEDKFSVL